MLWNTIASVCCVCIHVSCLYICVFVHLCTCCNDTFSSQGQLLVQACDWVSKSTTRTLVAAVVVVTVMGVVAYNALL